METEWRSEVLGVVGWDGRNTGEELILSRTIALGPDGRRNDGHRRRRAWRGKPRRWMEFPSSAETEGREEGRSSRTHK